MDELADLPGASEPSSSGRVPPPPPPDFHDNVRSSSSSSSSAAVVQQRMVAAEMADGVEPESYLYTYTEAPTEVIELESSCIWGTTVNVEESKQMFRRFFAECRTADGVLVFPRLMQLAVQTETLHIDVDCSQLAGYNRALYDQLVQYPQELLPIADICLNDMFQLLLAELRHRYVDAPSSSSSSSSPSLLTAEADVWRSGLNFFEQEGARLQLRTLRLLRVHSMRELNPCDVDTLISIKGMVTRVSPIIPELKQAYFECDRCRHPHTPFIDRGWVTEPAACPSCRVRGSLRLVHNRCVFANKQLIKLQETPDAIPEGETPNSVSLFVFDDLVDAAIPGDRVVVTGIFRASPARKSPTQRALNTLYRTYLDAIHFDKLSTTAAHRMAVDDDDGDGDGDGDGQRKKKSSGDEQQSKRSDEDEDEAVFEQRMKALGALPDIQERLLRSFAPSIWELDDVKKGLLCQLFGGVTKTSDGLSTSRVRGDINILLCGDPGTSKSQLLQYVHKLSPRGIYTSGKGSSAVGLTAYVTRDPDTRRAVLESGALVLSDGGICCIDEFDKMSDQTRSILHEAMEQQTVSVAKAGIICTLNARTAILAAANPRESRYNPRLSVIDNIQLDPPLLSRFDLIFLILDNPNPRTDSRLASHIVSLFFTDDQRRQQLQHTTTTTNNNNDDDTAVAALLTDTGLLPMRTLADYIAYAKRTCKPVLSDEAVAALAQGYVEMRKLGVSRKTVTATPRQLESTIRISEALAKMRLSDTVSRQDVDEALRLLRGAMQHAAMDPRTGTIDMDLITTGRSAYSRAHFDDLKNTIVATLRDNVVRGASISLRQLFVLLQQQVSITLLQSEVRDTLVQMSGEENSEVQLVGDRVEFGRRQRH